MKDDAATHLVQIVDEPHQIISSKLLHALLVLLPIKYVAELIVEAGCGPVEMMESL